MMLQSLKYHWREYLIEAWALGMFMVSACAFVILVEHPALPVREAIASPMARRFITGLAMGLTAVALIYSPWGKRSGAHMNPAVTLANLQMDRISLPNAVWYIIAQFAGGTIAVLLFKWLLHDYVADASVSYVTTIPGMSGVALAFVLEMLMAFAMLTTVLVVSNSRLSRYTGVFAGTLVMLFITFEAPYSGMSINPARTFASAFPSGNWTAFWIYLIAPVAGMVSAGYIYRKLYRIRHDGNCLTMKCHMAGEMYDRKTYEVLGPEELLKKQTHGAGDSQLIITHKLAHAHSAATNLRERI